MMGWFKKLFGKKEIPDPFMMPPPRATVFCMRQENTWRWSDHLGAKTEGKCSQCEAPVFFEKQNEPYVKVCHVCMIENAIK